MKNTNRIIIYINILAFSFCIFLLSSPEYKIDYSLLNLFYNISIAIIAASIFYIFIVFIPEQKRKAIIKSNFEEQSIYFKKECIFLFLSALGESSSGDLLEKLCKLDEFKKYFKEKYDNYPDKWHKVWENMNDYLLEDLLIQLGILKDEVHFVINNTEIYDKKVLSFFKVISQYAYSFQIRGVDLEYERKKELLSFLWELFSGWSFSEGYKKEDIVGIMIEKI